MRDCILDVSWDMRVVRDSLGGVKLDIILVMNPDLKMPI